MPFALMVCLLVMNLTLTWQTSKLFWVLMAYAAAAPGGDVSNRFLFGQSWRYHRSLS